MKSAEELAKVINPNPNEFDIKLVEAIILGCRSEIVKLIDEMIRLESNHNESTLSKGIEQMTKHAINKFTELRQKLEKK